MAKSVLDVSVLDCESVVTPNRSCGPCAACCSIFAVEVLSKPEYVRCSHRDSAGCTVYAERPEACRAYACLWLEGEFEVGQRPDLVGLAFDLPTAIDDDPDYAGITVITGREVRPGSADEPQAEKLILGLAWRFVVRVRLWGGETKLVGPRKLVDLVFQRVEARQAREANGEANDTDVP